MEINGFNLDRYFARINCAQIYPNFLNKCAQLVYNCLQRGYPYYAISGFRDPIEQDKLYAIGRTEHTDKKPVTNAKGFQSYHNFGLAIDFCFDKSANRDKLLPDWEVGSYKVLAEEAEKLGLFPGMKFKMVDAPHIQIPANMMSLAKLQEYYKNGAEDNCWKELDKVLASNNAWKSWIS